MRILHAIRSINPKGGGPIEGVKQLAAVNQRNGHTVEVVSLDDPNADWARDFPLPCHLLGPSRGSYGYSGRFVPWLREQRAHYDAVVVDGIWQYHALGTWRALAGTGTPYFVFTHGMLDPWFKRTYPFKHLKKWLYWPWGDYRVLRDARAVLFTCEEERRLARESFWLYRAKEKVVNFGTSAPTGDASKQRRLFVEKYPETRDKECLLYLGRVHVKKGVDLLLRAFRQVLDESGDRAARWHLIIAGPREDAYGEEMGRLSESLGLVSRITWTGMLTGDPKWGAFRQSRAFVLPSHQENFGIAVAEALACGLPVLISNKVNIWREIEADRAGLIVNDDLSGTTEVLRAWRDLPESARSAMAASATDSFRRRFHVEQSARMLVDALRTG